jgi:hypothetical protein
MLLTTHSLKEEEDEEDCDKIESVYQLATLEPEKEATSLLFLSNIFSHLAILF